MTKTSAMLSNEGRSTDEVQGIDYPFVWTPADWSRVVPGATVEYLIGNRGAHWRYWVCLTGAVVWSSERFGGAEVSCFVSTNPKMRFRLSIGELDPASLRDPTPELMAVASQAHTKAAEERKMQSNTPTSVVIDGRYVGGPCAGKTWSAVATGFTWTPEQRKKLVRGASFYLGRNRYVVVLPVSDDDRDVHCTSFRSSGFVELSRIDPNFVYPPRLAAQEAATPPSEASEYAKPDDVKASCLPPPACCKQKAKYGDSHSLGCVNRRSVTYGRSPTNETVQTSASALALERGAVLYNEVEDAQLIAADEGRAIWGAGWRK